MYIIDNSGYIFINNLIAMEEKEYGVEKISILCDFSGTIQFEFFADNIILITYIIWH